MNEVEQALKMIDDLLASVRATREDHFKIREAIGIIEDAIDATSDNEE